MTGLQDGADSVKSTSTLMSSFRSSLALCGCDKMESFGHSACPSNEVKLFPDLGASVNSTRHGHPCQQKEEGLLAPGKNPDVNMISLSRSPYSTMMDEGEAETSTSKTL